MRGYFVRGVLVGAVSATLALAASQAMAGTGIGGIFNLGATNSVNKTSVLTGKSAGDQLSVSNASSGSAATGIAGQSASATGAGVFGRNTAGGPALQAMVSSNAVAPLRVNSTAMVPNLDAGLLGGKRPSFYGPTISGGSPQPLGAGPVTDFVGNSNTVSSGAAPASQVSGSTIDSGTLWLSVQSEIFNSSTITAQLLVNGTPEGAAVSPSGNGAVSVAETGLTIAPGSLVTLEVTEGSGQSGGYVNWVLAA